MPFNFTSYKRVIASAVGKSTQPQPTRPRLPIPKQSDEQLLSNYKEFELDNVEYDRAFHIKGDSIEDVELEPCTDLATLFPAPAQDSTLFTQLTPISRPPSPLFDFEDPANSQTLSTPSSVFQCYLDEYQHSCEIIDFDIAKPPFNIEDVEVWDPEFNKKHPCDQFISFCLDINKAAYVEKEKLRVKGREEWDKKTKEALRKQRAEEMGVEAQQNGSDESQ
ncbi:hypothetical protein K504DRAFT_447262 [Pleomassaria siparia CBS 279.74]|uniref:Uncharacterized protein n=1 Tax=Pleomassaria siparia CBS 279.74 TaxID=1314801 RepID=A0A6G1K300_9PLEO|nr:hypothetical protein K504DRAFT_447262 [Pleomassaria siparia CBS 279.74]